MLRFWLLLLFLGLCGCSNATSQLAESTKRDFFEAEDFQGKNWHVKEWGDNRYVGAPRGYLSRQRSLQTDQPNAAAELKVAQLNAGTFSLAVHYEPVPYQTAPFTIEIVQDGKTQSLSSKAPSFHKDRGRYVWVSNEFTVTQGPALLRIRSGDKVESSMPLSIDCLQLNPPRSPVSFNGIQSGDLFVQLTASQEPITCEVTTNFRMQYERPEVSDQDWLGLSAYSVNDAPAAAPATLKLNGSPQDVGVLCDTLTSTCLTITCKDSAGKPLGKRTVRLKWTLGVDMGSRVIRDEDFTTETDGTLSFLVDGDVRRFKRVRQVREEAESLAQQLAALPKKGAPARNLVLNKSITSSNDLGQLESVKALSREMGLHDGEGATADTFIHLDFHNTDGLKKNLDEQQKSGTLKSAKVLDAGSLEQLWLMIWNHTVQKHREDHAGFREYLKTAKINLPAARIKSLDDAKLPADNAKGPLFYFAQRYYFNKTLEQFKQRSELVEKANASLSWGAPYSGSSLVGRNLDAQILHAWRAQAIPTPWVADRAWQNGEFSPQVLGYYLALARAARSEKPILCDIHAGMGNYPDAIRRSFYLSLAQGARGIRFVGATPPGFTSSLENLPTDQFETYKTIRELTHEAGQFESFLNQTKTRNPDIGIVLSLTQELWDPSLWVHEERKAIYHAARLSGHNVALITEDDIHEGRLQKLAAIYVVGTHLPRETVKVLGKWVKAGGCVAFVGGPFRDEYDRPNDDAIDLAGLDEATWEKKEEAGLAKITLAQQKPFDKMAYSYQGMNKEFPVVYGRLKVVLDEQKKEQTLITGKFGDGSPAMFKYEFHNPLGFVWTFCMPMGSGWIKTVLPAKPWERGAKPDSYNHQLLFAKIKGSQELDGDMGDIVMAASSDAKWDVITDNLAIETVLLESPNGLLLICINWSGQPEKAYLTTQNIPKGFDRATSLEHGPLKTTRFGVTLTLPKHQLFKVTDAIMIEK